MLAASARFVEENRADSIQRQRRNEIDGRTLRAQHRDRVVHHRGAVVRKRRDGNAGAVQAKFKCINDSLAAVPDGALAKDPQMKNTLVKHAEVLFEYYGDKLLPTQVSTAENLYTGWPGVVPGCSEPPDTALPTPNASGCNPSTADLTTKVLDGKLKMCDRLRDFHSGRQKGFPPNDHGRHCRRLYHGR